MNTALFYKVSKGRESIPRKVYKNFIVSRGISLTDSRIEKEMNDLEMVKEIDLAMFQNLVEKNSLLNRIFSGDLVIPEWTEFTQKIQKIFEECVKVTAGTKRNNSSIMRRTDENIFGVSITTIDGQRINFGDTDANFCASSIAKVFSYMLAVEENSSDFVHEHVGKEPAGQKYKSLSLKRMTDISGKTIAYIPHNPFSEAGGLMCSSLYGKELSDSERFYRISKVLGHAMGAEKIGFSYESFLSERNESDRKAYDARAQKLSRKRRRLKSPRTVLPTARLRTEHRTALSVRGHPRKRRSLPAHRRNCLRHRPRGLYDYSGEWAFKFGMPGKSSLNGLIIIAIPNKMGICIFSPRVDNNGISVRALRFAEMLVESFSFHHLDHTRDQSERREHPCQPNLVEAAPGGSVPHVESFGNLSDLMGAASSGDIDHLRGLMADPVDLMQKNYDRRTALHIAASKGFTELVSFLLFDEKGQMRSWREISQVDRWGLTPLDVAVMGEFGKIADILKSCGAKTGAEVSLKKAKEGSSGNDVSEVNGNY